MKYYSVVFLIFLTIGCSKPLANSNPSLRVRENIKYSESEHQRNHHNESVRFLHVRENQNSKKKRYYTDTALNFLKHYGRYYNLFDFFFDQNDTIIQTAPLTPKKHHSFSISEGSSNNEDEFLPLEGSIADNYLLRSYDNYGKWDDTGSTTPIEEYSKLLFHYNPLVANEYILKYNNKYRYGPDLEDRFTHIGLNYDIWEWDNKNIWFYHNVFDGKNPYYVYFVGIENHLHRGVDTFYCNFTYPIAPTLTEMERELLFTPVEIIDGLKDAIGRPSGANVIKCPVPIPLLKSLSIQRLQRKELEKEFQDNPSSAMSFPREEIHLDFVRLIVDNPEDHYNPKNYDLLLKDISIPRLHELDRRKFTYVIETMLDKLDDEMTVEWIVYNILLGVEHFYFFHNSKESLPYNFENSMIKPFLDANIVTLIYFPFLHTYDFSLAQRGAFNVHINIFGYLTTWCGYIDIDEFYVPSDNFLKDIYEDYSMPALPKILNTLAPDGNEPGIMLDSWEMNCPANSTNFYHSGNNLEKAFISPEELAKLQAIENTLTASTASTTTMTINRFKPDRVAVSTHCFRAGFQFIELRHGHGKMWLRPQRNLYLISPHRITDSAVIWGTPQNGGSFRHFDRFRYTEMMIKQGLFHTNDIREEYSLKNFTLSGLKSLIGIGIDRRRD